MFTSVTHLDLFDVIDTTNLQWPWLHLALLPSLTHLSLYRFHRSLGTELLLKCKKLQVLIRLDSAGYYTDNPLLSIEDVRFVYMVLKDDEYAEDWIIGIKGGMDFWARADAFVSKRRRGEIKPDSRCWIENGDGI
ncbi:hypothetical protein C8R44DRAFT_871898 [Mycena epipterygia]|nr:hypothetical protein C8R44DRAFT_871898 [Mycena epipterygia]